MLEMGLINEVDENGNEHPIVNKEKAAAAICTLLFGEPIKNWATTVNKGFSKTDGEKIFRKFLRVAQDKIEGKR